MPSLHNVIFNTDVIAIPHASCTRHDAIQYVENILDWNQYLINESWLTFYVSDSLIVNWYPETNQLADLLNRHRIVWFDANTVSRVIALLLNKAQSFESVYRVSDVLSENLGITPELIDVSTPEGLRSEVERLITLIAILRQECFQSLGSCSLIINRAIQSPLVHIRAQVCVLEHSRDDIPEIPYPPNNFEGDVPVCENFHGLIHSLDETKILVNASTDLEIEFAIRIALHKYAIENNENLDWHKVEIPKIGSNFRYSCRQCCQDQGSSLPAKILRSIRETMKSQKLDAVHPLRTGIGGNNPQIMRGSDKAQRRKIDYTMRLHYWEISGGKFELASINYHDEYSIPD